MAASPVNVKAVVQAVFNILSADARTSNLKWYYGRRSFTQVQVYPAGGVSLDTARDIQFLMPLARKATLVVLVAIRYRSEVSVDDAEQQMQDGLDKVMQVIQDNLSLGLSYTVLLTLDVKTDSNPEASPFTADALVRLTVELAPR